MSFTGACSLPPCYDRRQLPISKYHRSIKGACPCHLLATIPFEPKDGLAGFLLPRLQNVGEVKASSQRKQGGAPGLPPPSGHLLLLVGPCSTNPRVTTKPFFDPRPELRWCGCCWRGIRFPQGQIEHGTRRRRNPCRCACSRRTLPRQLKTRRLQ